MWSGKNALVDLPITSDTPDVVAFDNMIKSLKLPEKDRVFLEKGKVGAAFTSEDPKKMAIYALGKAITELTKNLLDDKIKYEQAENYISTLIYVVIYQAKQKSSFFHSNTADVLSAFLKAHDLPDQNNCLDKICSLVEENKLNLSVIFMMAKPLSIKWKDGDSEKSILYYAAEKNKRKALAFFLNQDNVNVNQVENDLTLLQCAVLAKAKDSISVLLKKPGIDILNIRDREGIQLLLQSMCMLSDLKLNYLIGSIKNRQDYQFAFILMKEWNGFFEKLEDSSITQEHRKFNDTITIHFEGLYQFLMTMNHLELTGKYESILKAGNSVWYNEKDEKHICILRLHKLVDKMKNELLSNKTQLNQAISLIYLEIDNCIFVSIKKSEITQHSKTADQLIAFQEMLVKKYPALKACHQFVTLMKNLHFFDENKNVFTQGYCGFEFSCIHEDDKKKSIYDLGKLVVSLKTDLLSAKKTLAQAKGKVYAQVDKIIEFSREKSPIGHSETADKLVEFKNQFDIGYSLLNANVSKNPAATFTPPVPAVRALTEEEREKQEKDTDEAFEI